jgi:small-conductance mechanosensitive channel
MSIHRLLRPLHLPPEFSWVGDVLVLLAFALAALLAHAVGARILGLSGRKGAPPHRLYRPSRAVLVAFALAFAGRLVSMDEEVRAAWRQFLGLVVPALLGWLAVAGLRAVLDVVERRADITVEDNLRARRKRTRAAILGRVGTFLIVFLTICLMLLSIPGIRDVGVTLMASAGIAGLVVGAAAQPALKNLIAGVQMAFTEPIRIDDVVIVEGEWGRIEDIRLTYVVIKLWDERRLVVPVSKFLEQSFQNWTRETSQLMGSVLWYLDPAVDVARLRAKVEEVVRANPRWDGRFVNCQVTDMKPDAVEVRALMTARDAGAAFDLRCDVREAVLAWLRAEMPGALPHRRVQLTPAEAGPPEPAPAPARP